VSRSLNPQDVVSSLGLGKGKLASFLTPMVAGLVSAIEECGVKAQVQDFAKKKAISVISTQSAALAQQGERCASLRACIVVYYNRLSRQCSRNC
jgi:hypothetical protein